MVNFSQNIKNNTQKNDSLEQYENANKMLSENIVKISEENEDRTTIMERAIQINEKIAQSNINAISAVFAKIYQDESEPSTWIQIEDNTWVKKK